MLIFKSLKSDGAVWWLQELLGDCRVCLVTVQVCSVTASPIPLVEHMLFGRAGQLRHHSRKCITALSSQRRKYDAWLNVRNFIKWIVVGRSSPTDGDAWKRWRWRMMHCGKQQDVVTLTCQQKYDAWPALLFGLRMDNDMHRDWLYKKKPPSLFKNRFYIEETTTTTKNCVFKKMCEKICKKIGIAVQSSDL